MLCLRGEKNGNIITFAQFEEENILTKTRNNAESGDESNDDSIMLTLLSDESMASISSSLSSGGISESSSSLSALLRVLVHIFPSSNCVNVIILPVFSLEDVSQGVYVTAGCIAIASE